MDFLATEPDNQIGLDELVNRITIFFESRPSLINIDLYIHAHQSWNVLHHDKWSPIFAEAAVYLPFKGFMLQAFVFKMYKMFVKCSISSNSHCSNICSIVRVWISKITFRLFVSNLSVESTTIVEEFHHLQR